MSFTCFYAVGCGDNEIVVTPNAPVTGGETGSGETGETGEQEIVNPSDMLRNFSADVMPITLYLGPNDSYTGDGYNLPSLITDKTYQDLASCGVNVIKEKYNHYGSNPQKTYQMLETAGRHGIHYFMLADNIANWPSADPQYATVGTVEQFKTVLTDLTKYDNFLGFYFRDEPPATIFESIKSAIANFNKAVEELNMQDEHLNFYLNAFPRFGDQSGYGSVMESWEAYLTSFNDMGANYLSWDMYPINSTIPGKVYGGWLNDLDIVRDLTTGWDKPWWGTAQCGGLRPAFSSDNRVVNEAELNWDVNTMLVFGAKGICYYTGVCPPEPGFMAVEGDAINHNSLLTKYGTKTPMYYYAQKINKQIAAIDHVLMNATHKGVIFNGETGLCASDYNRDDKLASYGVLKSVSGDDALVGCFDYNGGNAYLVMNNSITDHRGEITLNFSKEGEFEVIQRAVSANVTAKTFTLHLEAGECALVVPNL